MYTLCSSSDVFELQTRKPFKEVGNILNEICEVIEVWFIEVRLICPWPSVEIHSNTILWTGSAGHR